MAARHHRKPTENPYLARHHRRDSPAPTRSGDAGSFPHLTRGARTARIQGHRDGDRRICSPAEGEFPQATPADASDAPSPQPGSPTLIVTDADQEGDVVAFDIAQTIHSHLQFGSGTSIRAHLSRTRPVYITQQTGYV